MKDGEIRREFIRHTFSEEEKQKIAGRLARQVSSLNGTEDEKKAVMSEYKSKVDMLKAEINMSAQHLTNGYTHQNQEVLVRIIGDDVEFLDTKTNKVLKTRPLTSEERQMELDI